MPATGLFLEQRFFPGAEPGASFDELLFYRRTLSDGQFLYAMTFRDDTNLGIVDLRFLSSSTAPREFRLLELLVNTRNELRESGSRSVRELDTQWRFLPEQAIERVTLVGQVFVDSNDDGLRGDGDAAVSGARVSAFQCETADGRVGDRTTAEEGQFAFSQLETGNYQFQVTLPVGERFGRQRFASDGSLLSLIRLVTNTGTREVGWSDCVRYDADTLNLDVPVLP